MSAKPRSPRPSPRFSRSEERTSTHLTSQDEILERIEQKLQSPILNGGFDTLMEKVNRIEVINQGLSTTQVSQGTKIDAIYHGLYDPREGLYAEVKSATSWVKRANWVVKGAIALLATAILTGSGTLVYELFQGHIRYVH